MKKSIIVLLCCLLCAGKTFCEDLNAMYEQACRLSDAGDNEAAIDIYTKMIALSPKTAVLYGNRSVLLSRMGRYEDALRDCVSGLKIEPKNADLLNSAGVNCVSMGFYTAGLEYYEEAVKYDDKHHYAYNNMGFCRYLMGDYEGSIAALDKAIKIDPAYYNAYLNRGLANIAAEHYEAALPDIDYAVSQNDDAKLHIVKLYCLYKCSKKEYRKYKKSLRSHQCEDKRMLDFITRKWWHTGARMLSIIEKENEDKPKHEYNEIMCEQYFYYGLRYCFWKMRRPLKRYMIKSLDCDIPYFAEYYMAKQLMGE